MILLYTVGCSRVGSFVVPLCRGGAAESQGVTVCRGYYILCSGTRRVNGDEEKLPRRGVATVTTSQHTRRPGKKI